MNSRFLSVLLSAALLSLLITGCHRTDEVVNYDDPVDCINPYIGNISHLLIPTYPTIHLPNSMMRICPRRTDHTSELLEGLPLVLTGHRGISAFRVSPINTLGDSIPDVASYTFDHEQIKPYRYQVLLDEEGIQVDYAPSFRSAIYKFDFTQESPSRQIVLFTANGALEHHGKSIHGYEVLQDSTRIYLYAEFDTAPTHTLITSSDSIQKKTSSGVVFQFDGSTHSIAMRYGISYISIEQAKKNLQREISSYVVDVVAKEGRNEWQKAFNNITVKGGTNEQRTIFFTALYRTFERMICISEDGRYYSAFDGKVHDDEGIPFYTDDWVRDTYRAVHPLRILIAPEKEAQMVTSYIRMATQSSDGWLPTFPEVTGDSHRMNGDHAIAVMTDAYAKGITDFNLNMAYETAKKTMQEKSRIPWTRIPKTRIDHFMDEHGYMPALAPGQHETIQEVSKREKRQAVAVTLAASYDYWCLSQLATFSGHVKEAEQWLQKSYSYRHLFNHKTGFFHPRNEKEQFITSFDYESSGGQGARDYYDENNAYTYRWDVQHNPADLVYLMGGKEQFVKNLEETFRTPISEAKFNFYHRLPDQTGNVGQFSMANEPSMHIPYLFNYAGAPWKTQKMVHKLLHTWFRNDLMGIPGDEDGGALSAFVVFSMMGLYPVTPGMAVYNIGTPFFPEVTIQLPNNKSFTIKAVNVSTENKYIQSAELDGKKLNRAWIKHSELIDGNKLVLKMGRTPNKEWGMASPPPSADPIPEYHSKL